MRVFTSAHTGGRNTARELVRRRLLRPSNLHPAMFACNNLSEQQRLREPHYSIFEEHVSLPGIGSPSSLWQAMTTVSEATQHVPLMAGGRLEFMLEAPARGTQTLLQCHVNLRQMTVQVVFTSRCVEERLLFQFSERQFRLFEKALRVAQLLVGPTQLFVVD